MLTNRLIIGDRVTLADGQTATIMDDKRSISRMCEVDGLGILPVYAHEIMFVQMEHGREAIVHTRTQLIYRDQIHAAAYQPPI